ncbi:hypothetical protein C8E08_4644 [Paracidovorax citrulli]|nr:hypothetical protein C8E08_4644 [Paracidovorax citrulli]REG68630.1 hypothetical protein C8E07_1747 [Paracidovorax citrulli]RLJ93185.1 hypothetical protein C8E06_1747 [Paracidovorax citrulli]
MTAVVLPSGWYGYLGARRVLRLHLSGELHGRPQPYGVMVYVAMNLIGYGV